MKRILLIALSLVLLLTACRRTEPTPEDPASSTTAAAEEEQPVTVTGTWNILLPVDGLLDTAAGHAPSLSVLGENNVTLLRTAEPYVAALNTDATLVATLTLNEDGTGTLLITKNAMKQTTLTVVSDYNPLLKNVLAPVVEGFLPEDISTAMTYTFADRILTLSAVKDPQTAVVCRVERERMTVTGVVSKTLAESDRAALEELLKKASITR